jgi:hypothetical protein
MKRCIGLDVHAASCTLAVLSETGKKLKDFPVEANGQTDGYTLAFLLHIVSFTMAAVLFYCVRRPGAAVAGPR